MALSPAKPGYLSDFEVWLQPIVDPGIQRFVLRGGDISTEVRSKLFDRIEFQFWPDLKEGGSSASYSSESTLFRSEPYRFWESSSEGGLTLTTRYVAVDSRYNELWVSEQVARLKALTKPIYARSLIGNVRVIYGAPVCLFTYGVKHINTPVVITSVDAEPIDSAQYQHNGYKMGYDVTISMETAYPYGYVPGYIDWILRLADSKYIDPSTLDYNARSNKIPRNTQSRVAAVLDKYIDVREADQETEIVGG